MVRNLTSALTAAISANARVPVVAVTLQDQLQHFALYQSPNTQDGWHGACLASDGSIVRVRLSRGGNAFTQNFQFQRVTTPAQASQWASWTTLNNGSGTMFQDGGCAVSNNGGTLWAFAQNGSTNALRAWSSTTNAASWNSPVTVLTPPAGALIKGIASAGNNDVFFLYDVSGGEAIGCSFFSGGSWSSLRSWTLATIASGSGLDVWWDGTLYWLIYSDGYTLYEATYQPSNTTWTQLPPIAPATSTAIGRISPRLSFDSTTGLYNLIVSEVDSGLLTGSVYSYPRVRQSRDLQHWSSGFILHDVTTLYSAVELQSSTNTAAYIVSMPSVMQSPNFSQSNAQQFVDVSGRVLSYQRLEQLGHPARLELVLDNNQGALSALVSSASNYQPIGLNTFVVLSEGYKTGSPPSTPETVQVGTYHINQIIFERSPHENQLRLVAYDRSRNLDLLNRFQSSYSNQTVAWLITEICARAGFFLLSLPATTQMSQQVPSFVLLSNQSYRRALDELCSTYALEYFLDQSETLQFRELSASDGSVWSYQPEVELVSFGSDDLRGNHIIVTGKPPTGGQVGALTTGEAYDDVNAHLVGLERLIHHIDPKLTTTAQCQLKAGFLLAQEQRAQTAHQVSVPANPALQLLDVITLSDYNAPQGSGQSSNCRIVRSTVLYNAEQAEFAHTLDLEGV
ncbi:hypothetical protein EPA93_09240 [Ktedonosporobacter rubrisoli]|uniref:Uncharacterized protein n=1 Tax=Ktedonosporobacter rubrisoli TaxID=2509675 RepID=A0A4P6JM58_KTERU|nr:hypothetical protein [Ktedonosporobacter rubrisoli]QBD76183.1 hypothetical protein EPA93_09240 [Ktedonosporobacter rubrisoli]